MPHFFRVFVPIFSNLTEIIYDRGAPWCNDAADLLFLRSLSSLRRLIFHPLLFNAVQRKDMELPTLAHQPPLVCSDDIWAVIGSLSSLVDLRFPLLHPAVNNLTNLTSLAASCGSSSFSFKGLSNLQRLREFSIVESEMSFRGVDVAFLGRLTNLRHLSLHRMYGRGESSGFIECFQKLSHLESLSLFGNSLEELPFGLLDASAATLDRVNIDGCTKLKDIAAFETLPLLTRLELPQLSHLEPVISSLCMMTQLTALKTCFGSGMGTVVEHLAPFRNLVDVSCQGLMPGELQRFSILSSLTRLDVNSSNLTAEHFRPLTVLQELRLIDLYCPKLRKVQVEEIFPNAIVTH